MRHAWGVALLLASCVPGVFAQEFRATLSGQVVDASGGAIAGAKVRAIQRSTNQATEATTNQDGYYTLPFLQPSDYDVEVTASGFHKTRKENITLLVAQKDEQNFKLEVGQMTQEVTVKADVEVVQTADASGGM